MEMVRLQIQFLCRCAARSVQSSFVSLKIGFPSGSTSIDISTPEISRLVNQVSCVLLCQLVAHGAIDGRLKSRVRSSTSPSDSAAQRLSEGGDDILDSSPGKVSSDLEMLEKIFCV